MHSPDAKLPFGKHRGMTLRQCPVDYVHWVAENLRDTDLHDWALAAEQVLQSEEADEEHVEELDHEADDFLKAHGVDPQHPEL